MRFAVFLLIPMFLVGCGTGVPQTPDVKYRIVQHCSSESERQAMAMFVIDCASAANPKSDEEGEDLVEQCQYTAQALLCPEHRHKITTVSDGNGLTLSERIDEVDNDGTIIALDGPTTRATSVVPKVESSK